MCKGGVNCLPSVTLPNSHMGVASAFLQLLPVSLSLWPASRGSQGRKTLSKGLIWGPGQGRGAWDQSVGLPGLPCGTGCMCFREMAPEQATPGLIMLCFIVLHTYFIFFLNKLKVCGDLLLSKSVGTIFPTAFVHFLSLCHILAILAIFQNFSLLLYLLWWSRDH